MTERTLCGREATDFTLSVCENCIQMNKCSGLAYHRLRVTVIARDRVCQDCGSAENLQVHHEVRRKVAPSLALSSDNCILLCRDCHQRRHDEAQERYDDSSVWEDSPYYNDEWVLCSECGINYHRGHFKMCYSCWIKQKESGGLEYTW